MIRFRKYADSRRNQPLPVSRVPIEIIHEIFKYLSALDQICFALTCRVIYSYLPSFLELQGIALSRLLPFKRRSMLYRHVDLDKEPRVQFLRRIEDHKRWKFCSNCWKLHRPSAWQHRFLRSILPGQSSTRGSPLRHCMPYAGKQVICPCLSISFPDKVQLARLLAMAPHDSSEMREYYDNKILRDTGKKYSCVVFAHDCMSALADGQKHHPLTQVEVATIIWRSKRSDQFVVGNHYTFRASHTPDDRTSKLQSGNSTPQLAPDIKTHRMCPHKKPKRWLEQFFREAGWESLDLDILGNLCKTGWNPIKDQGWEKFYSKRSDCHCDWDLGDWVLGILGEEAWPFPDFSIGVVRNLGSVKVT